MFDLQTHFATGHAQRAFGDNMDGIRLERFKPFLDAALCEQSELDLRIGWQRHRVEAVAGMDDIEFVAFGLKLRNHALHGAHNAIHLRFPGVCYDHDAHKRLLIAPNDDAQSFRDGKAGRKANRSLQLSKLWISSRCRG